MTADLAIVDVGKSGFRLRATVDGGERTAQSDRGISPTTSGDQGRPLAEGVIKLLDDAAISADVPGIVVGATCDLTAEERDRFATLLRDRAPNATLALCDDGVLAHARALAGPGTVLSVGTGVIAVGMSATGSVVRFDGWGPLLGDRGSATEVGLHGLRQAIIDQESGVESELLRRARARFGDLDLVFARQMLADERWPAFVASFAEDVALAATQSDPHSAALVDTAAAAIVTTALHARDRCGSTRVAVVGRFGRSDTFGAVLAARLSSAGLTVVEPLDAEPNLSAFLDGPYREVATVWRGGAGRDEIGPVAPKP